MGRAKPDAPVPNGREKGEPDPVGMGKDREPVGREKEKSPAEDGSWRAARTAGASVVDGGVPDPEGGRPDIEPDGLKPPGPRAAPEGLLPS